METQLRLVADETLLPGAAMRLSAGAGRLTVLQGQVWATADGGEDHVLTPGQTLPVRDGARVVVEAWQRGQPAVVRWQPRAGALQALRFFAAGLRGAAFGAFAAFARSAASSASRAQGRISAGDSIASCGALK